jgi:hypothetical protein
MNRKCGIISLYCIFECAKNRFDMKIKIRINYNFKIVILLSVLLFLSGIFSFDVYAASNTCTCYSSYQNIAFKEYSTATASSEQNCRTACQKTSNEVVGYIYGDLPNTNFNVKMINEVAKTATTTPASTTPASTRFNYTLLESFPGFFTRDTQMTDFPAMIIAIYKFGIWTVGIAGFFMLVVGGFMYMASAGNTSTAGSARGIIWDALLGIVAALGAYLILYVINPDLTKVTIGSSFVKVDIRESEGTPMGTAGVCQSLSTGNCSVSNLTPTFGSLATQASSICNGESGGQSIVSTVDRCQGNGLNDPVSVGLFQINLSAHNIGALTCPAAFNRIYDANVAKDKSLCWVTDRILYDQCVAAAKNPSTNIAVAKSIYDKNKSWHPWGANKRSNCNFP